MLDTSTVLAKQMRRALFFSIVFGVGSLLWSGLAPLEGAVAANGMLVLENNVKKVQHPTGGVVGYLNVVEGKRVAAGELLVRLDETATRANLAVIVNDLHAAETRRARLLAERDGRETIEFPVDLVDKGKTDAAVAAIIDSELKVFQSRNVSRRGQKDQLRERIGQLQNEIEGQELQRTSAEIQVKVARAEQAELAELADKKLVPKTRLTALDREVARNDGALGDLVARIAQTRGKISETRIQIDQVDREKITEVTKDLRETETKISEFRERRIAAEDQLKRVEIRAPIAGVVQQLTAHTIGGVVSATDQLMVIIPDADHLIVEARVTPQDRDQLLLNQPTRVRFTSFNQRTTPEVLATLFRISGDVIRDTQTGVFYYNVGVRVIEDEIVKLNGIKLVAGLPAEAFFKTSDRTMLSYLFKPLIDHWHKTFNGV